MILEIILTLIVVLIAVGYQKRVHYRIGLRWIKYIEPISKYTGNSNDIDKLINITDEEYRLDDLSRDNNVWTISGGCDDESFFLIHIITKDGIQSADIIIHQPGGEVFSGKYHANPSEGKPDISCGPLLIERRKPFRKWRINFRGRLSSNKSDKKVFVELSGWWRSLTTTRFAYSNIDIKQCNKIISEKPFDYVSNLNEINRYRRALVLQQMGEYHAELKIVKDGEPMIIKKRYRGLRQCEPIEMLTIDNQQHFGYLSDSNSFTHRNDYVISHGNHFHSSHKLIPIGDFNLRDDSMIINDGFEIRKSKDVTLFETSYAIVKAFMMDRCGEKGVGFLVTYRAPIYLNNEKFPKKIVYAAYGNEKKQLTLSFNQRACQDEALTGGKGSNLAKLAGIEDGFKVPPGFVITTYSFSKFLENNQELAQVVSSIDSTSNVDEIGEKIANLINESIIPEEILKSIEDKLSDKKYAVRSSACGEDGIDLSSAGQLESILNVEKSKVSESVKLCWASNYRREVLNYRKNYGQLLNPLIAVVVQEMCHDDVAGVMFTANPVKLDRDEMVINAIRGAGELIVSGQSTPDEILVDRESTEIRKTEECCLDEEMVQRLVRVGTHLELMFDAPQDVEFVINHGVIMIVQSRNITGLYKESAFETYYELDTACRTDKEVLSNANVGEVCPVPMHALELETITDSFDKVMGVLTNRDINDVVESQVTTSFAVHHRKVFMNFMEMVLRTWQVVEKDRIMDIVVAGELLFDEKMLRQAEQRFGNLPPFFSAKRMCAMLKIIFYKSEKLLKRIKEIEKEIYTYIPFIDDNECDKHILKDILNAYEKQKPLYFESTKLHTELSMFSSFTYIISGMIIRGSDKGELSADNLSDIANLFSNNSRTDVVSADVPNSLKKLATVIRRENLAERLRTASDDEQALNAIKSGKESRDMLEQFIKRHGHRGPNETYLHAKMWKDDPKLLIHTIKSMVEGPETSDKVVESVDSVIDKLKCKPTGIRRTLLKYFLSQTHRGVAYREMAKDSFVSALDAVRQTCRILGSKLYQAGYLPDRDLWSHLMFDELKELVETRSPIMVARARKRKAVAHMYEGLQFPLVVHGHMEPINASLDDANFEVKSSLQGTVVCEGRVVAKARVAKNLEEAKSTQPGEVLITRYTDICWSPFFPIISGIVTEIGGLLSHGAVVAREYGLPSLIAVTNATNHFKTGDMVVLDTFKGTISKCETNE